ncbi:hypothetical protein [Geobacter grbiciae]|uniref:hypothetical protein n=1 Tax=Geobacter grbiciae TaxID=155042 RepID=UPI001C00E11A|nr:hypothetical protein [Geobacter grbiciae]MBT1075393.1 hypothetical protein [Geobacter grbiciae]
MSGKSGANAQLFNNINIINFSYLNKGGTEIVIDGGEDGGEERIYSTIMNLEHLPNGRGTPFRAPYNRRSDGTL